MAKYGITFSNFGTTTSRKTAALLNGGTTVGPTGEIVELIATGAGITTPADIMHQMNMAATTVATAGTNTAFTPVPIDPNGANAARCAAAVNYSAEGTTLDTTYPLMYGFNQRGGMRWAVPQGEGFKVQGSATKRGQSMGILSSAAGNVDVSMMFWEP